MDPFDDDAAAPERAARLVRTAAAPEDRITLTDEQEAIASLAPGHGPVLVLGAPGTGRTTVAVEYAARTTRHHGVPGLDSAIARPACRGPPTPSRPASPP